MWCFKVTQIKVYIVYCMTQNANTKQILDESDKIISQTTNHIDHMCTLITYPFSGLWESCLLVLDKNNRNSVCCS